MNIDDTNMISDSVLSRYRLAQSIMQATPLKTPVLNDAVFPHWMDGYDCFWYRRDILIDEPSSSEQANEPSIKNSEELSTKVGKEYRFVDATATTNLPAFDHKTLAAALTEVSGETVDPLDLPISGIELRLSEQASPATVIQVSFTAFDQSWVFDVENASCRKIADSTIQAEGLCSPDGKMCAFVRDYNVWIRDLVTGDERALTQDGCDDYYYATNRFSNSPVQAVWSPDSQYLFTHQLDRRQVPATPIVEHVPKDGSIRPQLSYHTVAYPEDGHLEAYRLVAVNVRSGVLQEARYPAVPVCRSYGTCFFTDEKLGWWGNDSRRAYFVDVELDSLTVRVVEFDVTTGATRVLFEEPDSSFINLRPIPEHPLILPLVETGELIWFSERNGYTHLYLYNLDTGKLKHAITEGEWYVKDVLYIDTEQRRLLVQTTHRHSTSPFYRDICWVGIDTGELSSIVFGDCEYNVYREDSPAVNMRRFRGLDDSGVNGVSPCANYLVVTRSRVDELPVSELIDHSGEVVLTLETAQIVGLPQNWQMPEPVTLTSADGQSEFYAVVFRPLDFSPDKQYPVLDFSCAHPAFTCVPRSAFINAPYSGKFFLEAAAYAALGFIVVSLDGPVEPYRWKALQAAGEGRLSPIYGFADRRAGLEQLADRFPYMDLDRVGVVSGVACSDPLYGLLEYPDFYKVGIVSEYEDTRLMPSSWSGLFSKFPECHIDEHASLLQGRLLLIHGLLDIEPPVASTMRLIDALQKANKDFDVLLLPNLGHEVSNYTIRRIWDYLVTHLQGVSPPNQIELEIV